MAEWRTWTKSSPHLFQRFTSKADVELGDWTGEWEGGGAEKKVNWSRMIAVLLMGEIKLQSPL